MKRSLPLLGLSIGILLFKLWLVGGLESYVSPWDPREYLKIAETWYWGDPSNYYRPPGFALFIAMAHSFGVPLRLATESLLAVAGWRAASATLVLGYPKATAGLVFLLVLFCPNAISQLGSGAPEEIVGSLTIWLAAETAAALVDRKVRRFVLIGLIAGWIYFTRPETILVLGGLLSAFAVDAIVQIRRGARAWSWLKSPVAAFSILLAVGLAVTALNGIFLGRFSPADDLNAPSYLRAYGLLQSVETDHPIRRVPVSAAQMSVIETVSPAFREITSYIRSKNASGLYEASKTYGRVPDGEIAGGWWLWAVRNGVGYAGYRTVAEQDRFYDRLSAELHDASNRGAIRIRWSPSPLIDPKFEVWLPHLPASVLNVMRLMLPNPAGPTGADADVSPDIRDRFDRMATRRTALLNPEAELTSTKILRAALPLWAKFYAWAVLPLLGIAAAIGVLIGWRKASGNAAAVAAMLFAMILGRIGIFALIDASAYPLISQAHYLLPAAVSLPFLLLLAAFLPFRPAPTGRPGDLEAERRSTAIDAV